MLLGRLRQARRTEIARVVAEVLRLVVVEGLAASRCGSRAARAPCSIATVYSLPRDPRLGEHAAIDRAPPPRRRPADPRRARPCVMPTLEPCVAGFTMSGSRSRSSASSKSCGAAQHHVVRRRHADRLRQALGAQLVHADRRAHHAAAGVGNAEILERALHACRPRRPGRAARSTPDRSRSLEQLGQRALARIEGVRRRRRGACSAASTALPVSSEISRSLESPPSSTATRPNSLRIARRGAAQLGS